MTKNPTTTLFRAALAFLAGIAVFSSVSFAEGGPGTGTVTYQPGDQTVEGDAPVYYFHVVNVIAPENLTGPIYPTYNWTVIGKPAGVSDSTALSYVSTVLLPDNSSLPVGWLEAGTNRDSVQVANWINSIGAPPAQFVFSAPGANRTIGIIFNGPPDSAAGTYAYKLRLSGWDGEGSTTFNDGTDINVRVLDPIVGKPTVAIASPADMEQFIYTVGGPAVIVPIVITGAAPDSFPLTDITGSVSGTGSLNNLVLTGMGTGSGSATTALLYTTGGIFSVSAVATNANGSASTSVDFEIIRKVPPPAITITSPTNGSVYSYTLGQQSGVTVPVVAVASTLEDSILNLDLTLDGNPVTLNVSGIGGLNAIGTLGLSVSAPGNHTLIATTSTVNGSATTSTNFEVVALLPAPEVEITSPSDGALYSIVIGGPATSIDFNFDGSVAYGPIQSVDVTVNGQPVTTSLSGVGTGVISGSGTITTSVAGSFVVVVTVTSEGGVASDSITVVVDETTATPPTIAITAPTSGSTFTFVYGSSGVDVPFSVVTSTEYGVITDLTATLDGNPLSLGLSGVGSSATATGTATINFTTAGTHTISAVGTAYGSAAATTTFAVQGIYPPPSVAILTPDDGFQITRFESDPATAIAFTYAATVDFGGIDTISVTVNGVPVTTTHSALGELTVTGSGTINSSATETFVIVVNTTSAGGSATDTVTVSVNELPDPSGEENCPATVNWLDPIKSGDRICGGDTLAIRFKLSCDGCTYVADDEVVVAVSEEVDGSSIADWLLIPEIDGKTYIVDFETDSGSHTYRVEVYRPVAAGSAEMVLLSSKLVQTNANCGSCGSGKSDKSEKSGKSGSSCKSSKSGKSGSSCKSGKGHSGCKSGKGYASDKSNKSGKSSNCNTSTSSSSPCTKNWWGTCTKKGTRGHTCSGSSSNSSSSANSPCTKNWWGACTKKGTKGHTCSSSSSKSWWG